MDTPIMFTPAQLATIFLSFCSAIIAFGGAIAVLSRWIGKAKEPNALQNKRLDEHEEWLKRIDKKLDNDNKRLGHIEQSYKIVLRALYALLQHGIDGNNTKNMQDVLRDLQDYLINNQ